MKSVLIKPVLGVLSVFTLLATLSACSSSGGGNDSVVVEPPGPPSTAIRINGAAQKGPYLQGSQVLIAHLSADGVPSPQTTLSEIQDDMGSFVFEVAQAGPVLIEADGYHFNEITGALSQGRLQLRAVYNATPDAAQTVYVNVLTHLAYKRTLALMAKGANANEAIQQAQAEVVKALAPVLSVKDVPDFTGLSLYDTDASRAAGNAYVLALSATVYQYATTKAQTNKSSVDAELTALLSSLADDIADDGAIDSGTVPVEIIIPAIAMPPNPDRLTGILAELATITRQLHPDSIRANLEQHSLNVRKQKLAVANIDLFVDSDGDGVINAQDDDIDNDGIANAEDASPYLYSEAPVLVANAATSGVASKTPFTLEWTTSEYAKQLEVRLVKDSADGAVVVDEMTATKQYTFTLDAGIYYVRARAQNALGGWGPWSDASALPVDVFSKAYFPASQGANFMPSDLIQTSDGGFLVAWTAEVYGHWSVGLMKLDRTGAVRWNTTRDNIDANYQIGGPFELSDGTVLVSLSRFAVGGTDRTTWILHLGLTGEELWRSAPVGPRAIAGSVKFSAESDGVVVGMTDILVEGQLPSGASGPTDVSPLVVKLDFQGNTLWSYSFDQGGDVYGEFSGLWKNADGSFSVTGHLALPGGGNATGFDMGPVFRAALSSDGSKLDMASTTQLSVDPSKGAPYGMDHLIDSFPASGGGFFASSEQYYGGLTYRIQRISSAGAIDFRYSMLSLCSCQLYPSTFQRADELVFGGALAAIDGRDLTYDARKSFVVVTMGLNGGAPDRRLVYTGDASGQQFRLSKFTPTTDGGFALLGVVLNDQGTDGSGFVLIKTDPEGKALMTVNDVIQVSP